MNKSLLDTIKELLNEFKFESMNEVLGATVNKEQRKLLQRHIKSGKSFLNLVSRIVFILAFCVTGLKALQMWRKLDKIFTDQYEKLCVSVLSLAAKQVLHLVYFAGTLGENSITEHGIEGAV